MVKVKIGAFMTKTVLKSRHMAVCILGLLFCLSVFYVSASTKTLCINDNGEVTYIQTYASDVENILEAEGINFREEDEVRFSGFTGNYGEIVIDRSFPVTVTADGLTQEFYVVDGTVADILEMAEITYRADDLINLPPSTPLLDEEHIIINRVDYETRTVTEAIPHEVDVTPSSRVLAGIVHVLEAGADGERLQVFNEKYVDGALVETVLVEDAIVRDPVTEYQLKGTVESTSPFEAFSGVEIDDTGRPANAVMILENQVATAYSARAGAKTASGRYAIVGHVAVDPAVIPYGTRLFIETTNGSYVYGYAIAADTGIALLDGRVDVDLFFGSYEESVWFGKRSVNIYILP